MTMRCSTCAINYPMGQFTNCPACESKLAYFQNDSPDSDWRDALEARLAESPIELEDKAERWRFAQLMRADYSPAEAAELARRRDVDLHYAVELRKKTELAYGILA